MTANKTRNIGRLKEVWRELDYAQRRLLEIRTGVPFTKERSATGRRGDELETLYRLPSRS